MFDEDQVEREVGQQLLQGSRGEELDYLRGEIEGEGAIRVILLH